MRFNFSLYKNGACLKITHRENTMQLKHILTGMAASLLVSTAIAEPLTVLDRNGAYVGVETYAPNIVRVTIGTDYDTAKSAPGYGFIAKTDAKSFSHKADEKGDDFASNALSLHINAQAWPGTPSMGERYFAPSLPPVGLNIKTLKAKPY
jgi:alpha-D-xyloside xylohydrolase